MTQVRAFHRLETAERRLEIYLLLCGACSPLSRPLVFRRRTKQKAANKAADVTRGASEPS